MKKSKLRSFITLALVITGLLGSAHSVLAQRGGSDPKTNSRILYHDGPVMTGTSAVYLIWYGNWAGSTTQPILIDLVSNIGSSPYFRINTTYPNHSGDTPSGAVIYAGSVFDTYSRGMTLTDQDIQQVVSTMIESGGLPLDTTGIYLVVASPDVTDLRSDGVSSFCTYNAPPHHGRAPIVGTFVSYGFVGSADRCPQAFYGRFVDASGIRPAPNGNFAADVAASTVARLLSVIVTSPLGTGGAIGGWYDRYGLENADKCVGKFGPTYLTQNGGLANMQLGQRHFLIQQNWVNDRKGYCSLSYS